MLATTIVPLIVFVNTEEEVLSQRRISANQLHDELQSYIWEDEHLPASYTKGNVHYHFTIENTIIKGCAEWKNVKDKKEMFCLYGYRQK